jgi:hypothetical protein
VYLEMGGGETLAVCRKWAIQRMLVFGTENSKWLKRMDRGLMEEQRR